MKHFIIPIKALIGKNIFFIAMALAGPMCTVTLLTAGNNNSILCYKVYDWFILKYKETKGGETFHSDLFRFKVDSIVRMQENSGN